MTRRQEILDRYNAMLQSPIPMEECRKGYVYELYSRNLRWGIYDGEEGFIGVREKFGSRYLFTEYHWDQGPPHGTVKPLTEMGPYPGDVWEGRSEDNKWIQNDEMFEWLEEFGREHLHIQDEYYEEMEKERQTGLDEPRRAD